MSNKVYKYPLKHGQQIIMMPAGAQIIHVGTQNELGCMWALVDTDTICEQRIFRVTNTGDDVPVSAAYAGTFLTHNGTFVHHLFEILKKK